MTWFGGSAWRGWSDAGWYGSCWVDRRFAGNWNPASWSIPRAAMLAAAADVAEAVGVQLAVENHGDVTTAQLLSAIRRADRPGVLGVCFDTANALRVGEDATAAARAVAELTVMVHLKDVAPFDPRPSVTGPCSVAYGTGVVPIDDVLAVLASAGFEGPVLVELGQLGPGVDECALVEECLDWLRVFTHSARTR